MCCVVLFLWYLYFSDQLELPFSQWSRQMVLSWLEDLGLGQYSLQCGKVVTCGQDLLKASPHQMEKDMGFKNPLHRKKLVLALQVNTFQSTFVMGDISLPFRVLPVVNFLHLNTCVHVCCTEFENSEYNLMTFEQDFVSLQWNAWHSSPSILLLVCLWINYHSHLPLWSITIIILWCRYCNEFFLHLLLGIIGIIITETVFSWLWEG